MYFINLRTRQEMPIFFTFSLSLINISMNYIKNNETSERRKKASQLCKLTSYRKIR